MHQAGMPVQQSSQSSPYANLAAHCIDDVVELDSCHVFLIATCVVTVSHRLPRWPFRLFWLLKSPPDQFCATRKGFGLTDNEIMIICE